MAFRLVARSPYLLGIFAIIALGSIAGAFMYSELLRSSAAAYPGPCEPRAVLRPNLDLWSSMSWPGSSRPSWSRWLIRFAWIAGALVTMPIVALASFLALAASPVLLVLAAGQVVRRGAGSTALRKPSREVLFTVVDAENQVQGQELHRYRPAADGSDLVGIGARDARSCRWLGARRACRNLRRLPHAAVPRSRSRWPLGVVSNGSAGHFVIPGGPSAEAPLEARMIRCIITSRTDRDAKYCG